MKKMFIVLCFLLTASCLLLTVYGQPRVEKIEPPSWWAGHSINPVRLLVRGREFQNAKVVSKNPQLKVSNIRVNQRGDYLFFDVAIPRIIKPAKYEFEVSNAKGKSVVPFEILPELDKTRNFQGITNEDIIYLIMTDRFANGDPGNDTAVDRKNPRMWHGGDFRGIIDRLDYLRSLGVTAIWLTPWYDNSDEITTCDKPWCPMASYHGYGAVDYYGVENHFGTMADLRELVEKAHAKGLKVVQDQVANHVGFRHPWMKNPPLDNWFPPFKQNTFNNSVLLSPNASPAERENLLKGWFDFSLPDMNHDEPEVVKYQLQNALWWIGVTGIDGIRQDTIQYMPRKFIGEWSAAILKQYPRFWMVGEVFEEDPAQTAFFQGGKAGWDGIDTKLPSVFDFKLWRTSQEVFTGKKPVRALRDVLKYDGLYPNINNVTVLANNHDTDRFMSLPGATLDGAMLHIAFILVTRGIPQLYAGEEIAMTGGHDPDNRKDFPGGWKGDEKDKFADNKTADERKIYWQTRNWIEIRKRYKALKYGKTIDLQYDNDIYVFARVAGNEVLVVTVNRSDKFLTIDLPNSSIGLSAERYLYSPNGTNLSGIENLRFSENGIVKLQIPPKNVVAYEVKKVLQ